MRLSAAKARAAARLRRPASRPRLNWHRLARRLRRRYPRRARLPLALVGVAAQRLYLIERLHLIGAYRVSTSRFGTGSRRGSLRTPLGAHRVREKIGAGCAPLTLFKARRAAAGRAAPNPLATISTHDAVCTRVLWLDGLEPGRNRGGGVDSASRCIYIHGTVDERRVGRPSSIGCVRMGNADVIEMFDVLRVDSLVYLVGGGAGRPLQAEVSDERSA